MMSCICANLDTIAILSWKHFLERMGYENANSQLIATYELLSFVI